ASMPPVRLRSHASPQALATASGSGLSCVSTSALRCSRATASRRRRRSLNGPSPSAGRRRRGRGRPSREGWAWPRDGGALVAPVAGDILPAGEDVAGVQAERDSLRVLGSVADGAQLLEVDAQRAALAGRGLEEKLARPAGLPEGVVEPTRHRLQSGRGVLARA